MIMSVEEVITADEWEDGRGYITRGGILHSETIEIDPDWVTDRTAEYIFSEMAAESGFINYMERPEEGKDTFYRVAYYFAPLEDSDAEPFAVYEMWYSDMYRAIVGD